MSNSDTRRHYLTERLMRIANFLSKQDIQTGVDEQLFNNVNIIETEIFRKKSLVFPDGAKIIPYMVFNDTELTEGGRMYGAFYVNCKKELRRGITINGEKTADIDGCAMHVQLLYMLSGCELPEGDLYLFKDQRRKITKKLMLLMMNTKYDHKTVEVGRWAVIRTYEKRFGKDHVEQFHEKPCREKLWLYMKELESFHSGIIDYFYQSNWGKLQCMEAHIMLDIIEMGIEDNVVVLPVHDGALCKRSEKEAVLSYFNRKKIIAKENKNHLKPLPEQEARALVDSYRDYKEV